MEKIPEGLKIKNRNNNILFDASLTAGVDYDKEQFDEEIDDKDHSLDDEEENEYDDWLTDGIDKIDENDIGEILD